MNNEHLTAAEIKSLMLRQLERRDVVIFHIETRKIESVAGRNLGDTGFHTLDKRLATVAERLNEHYAAAAVPVGKYAKDDVLREEDLDSLMRVRCGRP